MKIEIKKLTKKLKKCGLILRVDNESRSKLSDSEYIDFCITDKNRVYFLGELTARFSDHDLPDSYHNLHAPDFEFPRGKQKNRNYECDTITTMWEEIVRKITVGNSSIPDFLEYGEPEPSEKEELEKILKLISGEKNEKK